MIQLDKKQAKKAHDDRGINDSQTFNALDPQIRVDDTPCRADGRHGSCSDRVEHRTSVGTDVLLVIAVGGEVGVWGEYVSVPRRCGHESSGVFECDDQGVEVELVVQEVGVDARRSERIGAGDVGGTTWWTRSFKICFRLNLREGRTRYGSYKVGCDAHEVASRGIACRQRTYKEVL